MEEQINAALGVIVAIVGVVVVVFFFITPFYVLLQYLKFEIQFMKRFTLREQAVMKIILTKHFHYYKNLSDRGKLNFTKRLLKLMRSFQFEGKNGLEINMEMRVFICATIAKLTFRMPEYNLSEFNTIEVYPSTFRLRENAPEMYGATSIRGILSFSWEHILFGYSKDDDGINVAMHEVAHAMKINYFMLDSTYREAFKVWKTEAEKAKAIMIEEKDTFFRKSAYRNTHEFFAITIENFFERPELFQKKYLRLYTSTCLLLRQNPLNVRKDYLLD